MSWCVDGEPSYSTFCDDEADDNQLITLFDLYLCKMSAEDIVTICRFNPDRLSSFGIAYLPTSKQRSQDGIPWFNLYIPTPCC
eukprot:6026082-Amphidinium_carterae.1